jgi:hypothetical protein
MGGGDSFKAQWVLPSLTHLPALTGAHDVRVLTSQNCPQRCCACEV